MEYAHTSHNRPVYDSPPVGGSVYGLPRSFASLIPTVNLRHIFAVLVFATRSTYSDRQNVVNSQNAGRNPCRNG
jgi:hypothetical protein